jgi:hypothetical protein
MEYDEASNSFVIDCPHCGLKIVVPKNEINCTIFRHGALKVDLEKQMYQHLPEFECKRMKEEDLIYGCGKPFRFDGNSVQKCNYI